MRLSVLGWPVRVESHDRETARFVAALYGGFRSDGAAGEEAIQVGRGADGEWRGGSLSRPLSAARTLAGILSWMDDQITIGAQQRRPDLLFVHAATLDAGDRALLLIAESGGGKSTTTWAALHHGFRLLSDELAPVDPTTLFVHPYPRAVCLKAPPPAPYVLPRATLRASSALYVALPLLPSPASPRPLPLGALVFVSYQPGDVRPSLKAITAAEGAARLYAQCLNALAHAGDGLDVAARLAAHAPSFLLRSGDLAATSALLWEAMGGPGAAVRTPGGRAV